MKRAMSAGLSHRSMTLKIKLSTHETSHERRTLTQEHDYDWRDTCGN